MRQNEMFILLKENAEMKQEIKELENRIAELAKLVNLGFDKLDRAKNFNRFMSVKEFAAESGFAENSVRRMVAAGEAIIHYEGNKVYIHFQKTMDLLTKGS